MNTPNLNIVNWLLQNIAEREQQKDIKEASK